MIANIITGIVGFILACYLMASGVVYLIDRVGVGSWYAGIFSIALVVAYTAIVVHFTKQ